MAKKMYLESYGCQMNFSDSEIVTSILTENGFTTTDVCEEADVILLNTCSIRENAEQRVRQRLHDFKKIKKNRPGTQVGVLGCMAERVKAKFLEEEQILDLVVGPDAYRHLPQLLEESSDGKKAVNVILSKEETYSDINPVRTQGNGVTAFISIMRGCDNMCSFCVVPFTRGRERSRNPESILREARMLFESGYREVTLLGQNVDSYRFGLGQNEAILNFAGLLEKVASIHPELRVRFSTSHPKDMTDEVLHAMARHENICKYIHLPVQSGSTPVLERMNRGYDRTWYLERIASIRKILPGCGISSDIIAGFCGETEADHQETLRLMEFVGYDFAYMFMYSERPRTLAERKYDDDITDEVKRRRLHEIVECQKNLSRNKTLEGVGKMHKVLAEGTSKKSKEMLMGRNSQNNIVVFPTENKRPGDYVNVIAEKCSATTLIGRVID